VDSRDFVKPPAHLLLPALSDALHDPDREVRVSATEALRQVGVHSGDAFPPLMEALRHPDPAVRIGAMEALCDALLGSVVRITMQSIRTRPRVPPAEASARILELVSDPSAEVRAATIDRLVSLGTRELVRSESVCPPIVEALDDAAASVRSAAVTAVGYFCPGQRNKLEDLVDDGDERVRQRAILEVAGFRAEPGSTIHRLAALLQSPEATIRSQAVVAIRWQRRLLSAERSPETAAADQAVALAALSRALRDDELEVRVEAARALGDLGGVASAAAPDLAAMATGAADSSERRSAAQALARIGTDPDGTAAVILVHALFTDSKCARWAARALMHLGDAAQAALVPGLKDLLRSGTYLTGLREALKELGPEAQGEIARVLGEAVGSSEDPAEQLRYARYLEAIGPDAGTAVPMLTSVLAESSEEDVRAAAAAALGSIGSSTAADALRRALDDPMESVRRRAAASLGKLRWGENDDVTVAELVSLLESASASARRAGASGLAAKGADAAGALPGLIEALDDDDFGVALAVRRSLRNLGSEALPAVPALIASSRDESFPPLVPETRRTVVEIAQTAHLVPASLTEALSDESDTIRWFAASTLREIPLPAAGPPLARSLDDPDDAVRFQSALAVVEKRLPSTGPASRILVEALRDLEPERYAGPEWGASRESAVDAALNGLWKVPADDPTSIALHIEVLHHTDPKIRLHAIHFLGRAGPAAAKARALLEEILLDRDEELRSAAAAALAKITPVTSGAGVPRF
jgi:HEAT repeat protein